MVRIVEVGPRDGLQNEAVAIPVAAKAVFLTSLADAGLSEIEVTSFVSSKAVPQLADADELWPMLPPGPLYSALVPNERGLARALAVGINRIAVFTAVSDAFTKANIGMTVEDSLARFADVVTAFRDARPDGWVRGYVSTAFECPYAGRVDPRDTVRVAKRLFELGVDEVSVGDTIGVAVPSEVEALTVHLLDECPRGGLAYHFHDTRGTAIANTAMALDLGIEAFDSSAAGLGGCPYAPGAGGNLATEDLVYFLERSGLKTGVDLRSLARASLPILEALGRPPSSKVQRAVLSSVG